MKKKIGRKREEEGEEGKKKILKKKNMRGGMAPAQQYRIVYLIKKYRTHKKLYSHKSQ